jgi:L-rhamnose mutarotase
LDRRAWANGIDPTQIKYYDREQAAVWRKVLARITVCTIRNYTIFVTEPGNLLSAHYEYHATDFAVDTEIQD